MAVSPGLAGARDFDFLFGSWRIVNERLTSRLTGSEDWERFEATGYCRPILSGVGNVDAFCPDWPGREGFEGAALRLFNPASGQWSIYWADNVSCQLQPPVVGTFVDGVGAFFGDDQHEGKPVLVRFRWSEITATAARWEQACSVDAGVTWETNWIMTFTRIQTADGAAPTVVCTGVGFPSFVGALLAAPVGRRPTMAPCGRERATVPQTAVAETQSRIASHRDVRSSPEEKHGGRARDDAFRETGRGTASASVLPDRRAQAIHAPSRTARRPHRSL